MLAAASAVTGVVTYRSREELAALLGPDDADAIARRAAMLEEAALASQATGETISLPDKVAHVMASIAAGASAGTTLSDEIVVRLARELSDHQVRDACLLSAGPEQAMAAEWLWAALTRMTPAPERAEAACLLAVSAYLRGDGALAGVALECAEEADPGHQLTSLLRQVQQAGLPPDWLASTLRRSVAMAKRSAAEGVG